MTDYDKLRELAQQATPGPWLAMTERDGDEGGYCNMSYVTGEVAAVCTDQDGTPDLEIMFEAFPGDAEFIAAANPAVVLALLDELRDAKADAWDEGYWQGAEAERYETDLSATPNPYRKDTK